MSRYLVSFCKAKTEFGRFDTKSFRYELNFDNFKYIV